MKKFVLIRKTIYKMLFWFDLLLGNKPKVFVLCYHSISNDWLHGVSFAEFKKQINFLGEYYQFITPDQLTKYLVGKVNFSKPAVLITFDDGYEDILQAKGFLKSKNIKPLLFLLSEKVVNRNELATEKSLLTSKQVFELKKLGWKLGSHGQTHSDFWSLNPSSINEEIADSKDSLQKMFKTQINYFAFPKGRYTRQALDSVKNAKYKLAFSMDDGCLDSEANKFTLPRIGINQTHSFEEFKALFSPSVVQFRKVCKTIKLERAFA